MSSAYWFKATTLIYAKCTIVFVRGIEEVRLLICIRRTTFERKEAYSSQFFADIATHIIFLTKYCLVFIQDILFNLGLARNSFLQGYNSKCRNEEKEKTVKLMKFE